MYRSAKLLVVLAVSTVFPSHVQAQEILDWPASWQGNGMLAGDYRSGRDSKIAHGGEAAGFIEATVKRPRAAGFLRQNFNAAEYAGKRVRMTAYVRTENVVGRISGLTMTIDTKTPEKRPFDNMFQRAVRGTTDWQQFHIVLDVPKDAIRIVFGAELRGSGKIWVDDFQFEPVDENVAETGWNLGRFRGSRLSKDAITQLVDNSQSRPKQPRNLGFEEVEVRRFLGVRIEADSTKVLGVTEGSVAAGVGIDAGDVILKVDGQEVANLRELSSALDIGGSQKEITVLRGEERLLLNVDFSVPVAVTSRPASPAPKTILDSDTEFVEGSRVEIAALNATQTKNLVLLGKVWGFLKYHHPSVAGGKRHWDFDLFRVLPGVLDAGDRREVASRLLTWIENLGEVPPVEPRSELGDDFAAVPRLDWLQDEALLGPELSRKLQQIYRNRPTDGKQFYVTQQPGVGNPIFETEQTYEAFPDAGYRILALFRYWNIIEYWFPYRDLIDRDWDETLAAYLPTIVAANDEAAYQLACLKMIAEVGDGHAGLWSADTYRPPVGDGRLPVVVRFIKNQAVVVGLAGKQKPAPNLQVGDVLTKIDGEAVDELIRRWQPFYWGSNRTHRMAAMAANLTRGTVGLCELEIKRDGEVIELQGQRVADAAPVNMMATRNHDLPGDTFRLLGEDVAYLKLSSVNRSKVASYVEKAVDTKGMIIDIRNYPSEFVVFELGGRLIKEPTPIACFTKGDLSNPGAFTWIPPISLQPLEPGYRGQVVILVDETSLSQAEYTAMAFRAAPNAIVVGSTTAGADGNFSAIRLPGGISTGISGIGVFYPDRTPTQRVGIVPDVEVHPSITGIREGRDEVLEEAIRQIVGNDVPADEMISRYR